MMKLIVAFRNFTNAPKTNTGGQTSLQQSEEYLEIQQHVFKNENKNLKCLREGNADVCLRVTVSDSGYQKTIGFRQQVLPVYFKELVT